MNQRLTQISCLMKIINFAKLFVSFDDSKAHFEWFSEHESIVSK
jgi:hypothetical protein